MFIVLACMIIVYLKLITSTLGDLLDYRYHSQLIVSTLELSFCGWLWGAASSGHIGRTLSQLELS